MKLMRQHTSPLSPPTPPVIVHRCRLHVYVLAIRHSCAPLGRTVLILRRCTFDPQGMFFFLPPQVPNSALSFRKAPPAPALSALHQPLHHRGGVLQEDHRQRPHHQAPLGHVQVQRHLNRCWDETGAEVLPHQSSQCQITAGAN